MATPEHQAILAQGSEIWNRWRTDHPAEKPDLSGANFSHAELSEAQLDGANLSEAHFNKADLRRANLSKADLTQAHFSGAILTAANLQNAILRRAYLSEADLGGADLSRADLNSATLNHTRLQRARLFGASLHNADFRWADLSNADLSHANFIGANLSRANLTGVNFSDSNISFALMHHTNLKGANLSSANLTSANLTRAELDRATCISTDFSGATLIHTSFEEADLRSARIYGISAWDVRLEGAIQKDLVITPLDATNTITVDDLEIAQFIYLIVNNHHIRKVIDSITAKVVLILGRFTPDRKAVLDAVREELRKRDYIPVVFDFEQPSSRDLTETVFTLAHMAKFVIADLTDPRSLPQELATVVPNLRSVPIQPILLASEKPWAMYKDLRAYPWVLRLARYTTTADLLAKLNKFVIDPPERWLERKRRKHRRRTT